MPKKKAIKTKHGYELIYIWIEKYKNIQNMGFNFSHTYECHCEPTKKEFSIKKTSQTDKFLEGFYGKNIRIKAIVGKNGAGKTNFLKAINNFFRFSRKKGRQGQIDDLIFEHNRQIEDIFNDHKFKYFTVLKKGNQLYYYSTIHNEKIKSEIKIIKLEKIPYSDINGYYYSLTDTQQHPLSLYVNKEEEFKEKTNTILNKNRNFFSLTKNLYQNKELYFDRFRFELNVERTFIQLEDELEEIYKKALISRRIEIENRKGLEKTNKKEDPFHVDMDVEMHLEQDQEQINDFKKIYLFSSGKRVSFSVADENEILHQLVLRFFLIDMFEMLRKTFLNNKISSDFFYSYLHSIIGPLGNILILKGVDKQGSYIKKSQEIIKETIEFLKKSKFDISEEHWIELEKYTNIEKIKGILSTNLSYNTEKKFFLSKNSDDKKFTDFLFSSDDKNICKSIYINYYIRAFDELGPSFRKAFLLNYYDSRKENCTFNDLSSGEKEKFFFISDIYYQLLIQKKRTFLLDEPEITLHPEWQRRLIYDITETIKFFKKNNKAILPSKDIFIIISTHSPFILTDILIEDIFFLKKDDKTGNAKQISAKESGIQNTFFANIHTLLLKSFFMDDTVGEFAKQKLKMDVIAFIETHINRDEIVVDEAFNSKLKYAKFITKQVEDEFLHTILSAQLDRIENASEKVLVK